MVDGLFGLYIFEKTGLGFVWIGEMEVEHIVFIFIFSPLMSRHLTA